MVTGSILTSLFEKASKAQKVPRRMSDSLADNPTMYAATVALGWRMASVLGAYQHKERGSRLQRALTGCATPLWGGGCGVKPIRVPVVLRMCSSLTGEDTSCAEKR